MRGLDLDRQRVENWRARLSGARLSPRALIVGLAVVAIVLAFLLRPGQSSEEAKSAGPNAATKPTATVGLAAPAPKPSAMPATSTPAAQERIHEVASGDTLSKIAEKYYNDSSKWQKIYDANKASIPNPDSLQLGQKLKIPE